VGNDLSQALRYGKAGNCTKLSDGTWSGGAWSNAVYNAKTPDSNYFLILEDDVSFLLPDDFVINVNKFLSNPENKWDVLLLAGNNLPPFTTNDEVSIQVSHCQTTTGYIVKNHYYDTLIANIKEGVAKLMKNPEHHYYFAIDKYWLHLQKQHRWMLLIPLIVVQRPDYSDIEKRHTDYQRLMTSIDKTNLNVRTNN
jgi:GR25 family glycosyltransferase involved in LPS biosynthesis